VVVTLQLLKIRGRREKYMEQEDSTSVLSGSSGADRDYVEHFRFQVRRSVADIIWKEAALELTHTVTFPETEEVLNGRIPETLDLKAALTINNLKRSWEFLFEQVDFEPDYQTMCEYNRINGEGGLINNAGKLRTFPVQISGTTYKPNEVVVYGEVAQILENALNITDPVEKALKLLGEITRGQWFSDGNKRTAQLMANHVLIKSNVGWIAPHSENKQVLGDLLADFYETGSQTKLNNFLLEKCFISLRRTAHTQHST
jgi:hypothetical protein